MQLAWTALLLVTTGVSPVFAAAKNDLYAAKDSCKDDEAGGKAQGLCHAFCVAKKCTEESESQPLRGGGGGLSKSCQSLRKNYLRITGKTRVPCEVESTTPPTYPPTNPPTDPPTDPLTFPPTSAPSDTPTSPPSDTPTGSPTDPPTDPTSVTCPCWTIEEIRSADFSTVKSCQFDGPTSTFVRDSDQAGTIPSTLFSASEGSKCGRIKEGVRQPTLNLSPEEYEECARQIVAEHCSDWERDESVPLNLCPCWPDGLDGPSPPAIYERCSARLYPDYERFEYNVPCGVKVYETICSGGFLSNYIGVPKCRAYNDVEYILDEVQYQACRNGILGAFDDWAESSYF